MARSRPHGQPECGRGEFQSERQVVEEERRVRVDNQPYGSIEEDLRAAAFTVHGYHHTPIGSIEDLNKATLQDVRDFHNTFYKPNNATLVIVGDFNSEQALAGRRNISRAFRLRRNRFRGIDTPEPPQTARARGEQVVFEYAAAGRGDRLQDSGAYTPDAYPLDLAANILAGGESSRLYQTLVYKDQIAVQAAGFGNFTEDPNLFWAYAIMNQGHTAEEGEKAWSACSTD